jgi:hypothetical protein
VSLEPYVSRIFWRAPFKERAKGPFMREQPLGRITMREANSLRTALKCPPRSSKWLIASGMKSLVELNWMGPTEIASFMNFSFSAFLIA